MKRRYTVNNEVDLRADVRKAIKAKNEIYRQGVPETQRDFYPGYIRDDGKHDDFCDYWAQVVYSSPLANASNARVTQFIEGTGLSKASVENRSINGEQTFIELHKRVVQDYALWDRLALKVMTTPGGVVTGLKHVPAEQVRYEFPDKYGKVSGVWCMPFINSTEDKMRSAYWMPIYKPGQSKADTRKQRAIAKEKNKLSGIKEAKYYGHCYFYNNVSPINRVYSRPRSFSAERDCLADGRVGQGMERLTANSFLSPGALVIPGDPNEGAYREGDPESQYQTKGDIINKELSESMAGSPNAGAITTFFSGPGDALPAFIPFQTGDLHKLFTESHAMLTERISIGFNIPQVLLGVRQPGQLGENQQIRDAILYANETTAARRKTLEEIYRSLLSDINGFNVRGGIEIIPVKDFTDISDAIYSSLTPAQQQAYINERFGIDEDTTPVPEATTQTEAQEETEQQNESNE